MRSFIFILLCTLSISLFAQSRDEGEVDKIILADKFFKSNGSCFELENRETYELYDYEPGVDQFDWGYFISFTDSTFSTSYSAPCGNDCFTSVAGSYKYVGYNKIEVFVSSINRNGFCRLESEKPNKIVGIYLLEQTAIGITLQKE